MSNRSISQDGTDSILKVTAARITDSHTISKSVYANMSSPLTYKIDEPVPIIEGRAKFHLADLGIIIDVAVKRLKDTGDRSESRTKELTELHREILKTLLELYSSSLFTTSELVISVNNLRSKNNKKVLSYTTIQGRLSELSGHDFVAVASKDRQTRWYNVVSPSRIRQALSNERLDV